MISKNGWCVLMEFAQMERDDLHFLFNFSGENADVILKLVSEGYLRFEPTRGIFGQVLGVEVLLTDSGRTAINDPIRE